MSRSALVPYTAKDSYAADEYMGDVIDENYS